MYSTILVPLDGSPLGERALPVAVALARRSRAHVELIHVRGPGAASANAPMYDTRLDEELEQEIRDRISALTGRLSKDGGVTATAVFLRGDVVRTLDDHAAARGVDLIVMTSHGRGGFNRAWLGSVADELMRRATVPLLILRPDTDDASEVREPIFRRVLVPLDGSERAEDVLAHAAALGVPEATEYLLLNIVTPRVAVDPFPSLVTMLGRADLTRRVDEERARADDYLARVAHSFREIGATVSAHTLVDERAAPAILEFARERAVDLIVLSTRVRTATERVLVGSVADKVARGASVPILISGPHAVPGPLMPVRKASVPVSSERERQSTGQRAPGVAFTLLPGVPL